MGCHNRYKARGCSYTECKSKHILHTLALWRLVTNYVEEGGGATKRQTGASEVLPLEKGGGGEVRKCFSRVEGRGDKKVLR